MRTRSSASHRRRHDADRHGEGFAPRPFARPAPEAEAWQLVPVNEGLSPAALSDGPVGRPVMQRALGGVNPFGALTGSRTTTDFTDSSESSMFQHDTIVLFQTANLNVTGERAGVKMTADPVGPNHAQGSAPSPSVFPKYMKALRQHYRGESFVRGHLLNGDIGGPGQAENLFPITKQANSHHYQYVEKQVKEWVNDYGAYVRYQVEVKNINKNGKEGYSEFHCNATPLSDDGYGGLAPTANAQPINKLIISNPGSASGTPDTTSKYALGHAKREASADIELQYGKLPADWNHLDEDTIDALLDLKPKYVSAAKYIGQRISGLSEEMVELVIWYYETRDPRVQWETSKNSWNKAIRLLTDGFRSDTWP